MEAKRHVINQRRMRVNPHMRELASRVNLSHKDFIQPLFADQNLSQREPIAALNGMHTETIDSILSQISADLEKGISKFLLFPVPVKNAAKEMDFSFAVELIESIKWEFGDDIWLSADCCLCSYTRQGHCGVLTADGEGIDNEKSVAQLSVYALLLAEAGADNIAPSDMMDGRIAAIRNRLDAEGYDGVSIMSYAAKFSSQLYGPFRDICHSAPSGKIQQPEIIPVVAPESW